MRLATYRWLDRHFRGEVDAAWVEPDDSLVCLAEAYEWDCHARGEQIDGALLKMVSHVQNIIESVEMPHRFSWLDELQARWRQAILAGNQNAASCRIDAADVQLMMPLQPRTFRDFYAFEQHVKTSRGRRGLDMVPEWYQFPVFYFSNQSSFVGPSIPVHAPAGCAELDFELEIACVIGAVGESVDIHSAENLIAGYVILNDWSARDIQRAEMKVGLGPAKGKDFATSFGPYLVTPSELEDVAVRTEDGVRYDLQMRAYVNGECISSGNFRDIHFTFAQMIERASRDTKLYPGDVLGSGTVGTGCILELGPEISPWLRPGDVVRLEVSRCGVLETSIVERSSAL